MILIKSTDGDYCLCNDCNNGTVMELVDMLDLD